MGLETKELVESIYSLLKLEIENEVQVKNNEIVINLENDNSCKIKLTKIL